MLYDIDRIRSIISNFDPFDLMTSEEININAFLYAVDSIIPVDEGIRKLFFKFLKTSSYSTVKTKHVASIILQYPTIMRKVVLVNSGQFLKNPYLQLCFVKIPGLDSFELETKFTYPDKSQFDTMKEMSMREMLKYLRDTCDHIVVNTPALFLNDREVAQVENSFLGQFPTLGLSL